MPEVHKKKLVDVAVVASGNLTYKSMDVGVIKAVTRLGVLAEFERRRAHWSPPVRDGLAGALEKYAATVGPANLGAVTHSGNARWEGDA
ncbi:MAG: hypothetical protein OXH94_15815 [Rhodospirillales bacterium]|nr:hypothetical protein [Rhodospirillales bacterium]